MEERTGVPCFRLLGVRVHAVQISDVVTQMERWIHERARSHFIAVTGMHGLMEAKQDAAFKRVLNSADLVVPDGTPLVWVGRRYGFSLKRRVYGPELMETFCSETGPKYRHFFLGGAPGVADQLARILEQRYGLCVVGTYSPPFRPLTNQDEEQIAKILEAAAPDVAWIGLSTPKQERWMHRHQNRLRVPVLVGVGAAFDFKTGRTRQAPEWIRENGFEWLFRLLTEPRRLWRRYLIQGSQFTWNVSLEVLGLKRFE